jgi:hypothetical protein
MNTELTPDTRLTRKDLADQLTRTGFPIALSTLAMYARSGDGPPFDMFGPRAMYVWGNALTWAKDRTRPPARKKAASKGGAAALENDAIPFAACCQ